MIKLAIGGIHGSGKTILIDNIRIYLKSLNKTIYHVEEAARICPYELGTIKAQRWIWEAQINEEIKGHESNCDIILCDRTLVDNLMYYKYILNQQKIDLDPVYSSLWDSTISWMETYDYISVLPMNPEFIVNDGVRITDINKTIEIEKLFIKYVKPYQNIDLNRYNYKEKIIGILNDKN